MTCMIGTTILAVAVTTGAAVTYPLRKIQTEQQCKQSMAYYNQPKFKRTENIAGNDFLIPHHFCVPCNGWQNYKEWYDAHRNKVTKYTALTQRPFLPLYTRKEALIALLGAAATTDDRTGQFSELGRINPKTLLKGQSAFRNYLPSSKDRKPSNANRP